MPHSPARALVLACFLIPLLWVSASAALSFQADFRSSTYDTQSGDDFSSLLAQHQSETLIESSMVSGFDSITSTLLANGVERDYTVLLTTVLTFSHAGNYKFQVGTDWGRGGAAAVLDSGGGLVSETVYDHDLWWDNDWDHPHVFITELDAAAGESYTLQWVGFEGCCGGDTSVRFAFNDGAYQAANGSNLGAFARSSVPTPEPGTGLTVAMGVAGLGVWRRRQCGRTRA